MGYMKLRILLADDHSVVRQGVSLIIKKAFKNAHINHEDNFAGVLRALNENIFDLIVLDINMEGGDTTNMITDIKLIRPNSKILMFSAYEDQQYALRYIHAGANGYINKMCEENELVKAINDILTVGVYVSESMESDVYDYATKKVNYNPLQSLSNREIEVARLLVKGYGNLEISNKLKIQMSTVSTYKQRMFEKLGISNIMNLAEMFNVYEQQVKIK